ncbi:MAG: Cof-type HAD-IIB family hydrolase [Clostridiaceae bacterium]|nr:Cof-type HAD-IIB family hydrolase [Clostridiaceae bacterium]
MHNIKLIALDLDGTLLNSDKQLSPENRAALEKAAGEGVEIVPATGRFYKGMPEIIRELPFVRYVISINGAQVYDAVNGKTVCSSEIPWERAVSVMEHLDTLDTIYDCYQDGWGWMTEEFYNKADRYAAHIHSLEMIKKLRTPVPELKAYLANKAQGVQKVQAFFKDMELREEVLKMLPTEFPDLVITTSIVNNIEINSREATKGVALEKLAAYLGIPLESTMAFGDDTNDITMLEAAGIGVAMGNAYDAVKRSADFVTSDCDENGVAYAINHFLWEK